MTSRFDRISAVDTVAGIAKGSMTAEDAMQACVERIVKRESEIRAFVEFQPERAMGAARAADEVPPDQRGPLHGLPVAVKSVFDVAGMRCNWGTEIHADRMPRSDAVVVQRLKDAGAVIVGTTVSTEYAISAAGPTTNPFDASRTPGGSSSGSAAAVASGMVPVALGSQTVGSVVRPSIYCGLYGLKPTRGAIPKRGGMALSARLDHPGILARTPEDVRLMCRVLFARDLQDPDSSDIAPPSQIPDLKALRILSVPDWPPDPVSQACAEALARAEELLTQAGAAIEPVALPDEYKTVVEVLYAIMTHDMALEHGEDRDRAGDRMSALLRDLIDRGRRVSEKEYAQAVTTADRWRGEMELLLSSDAVMLSAATEDVAPPRTEGTGSNRQQALWSLLGLPVMAVPTGAHGHLPIGVQIGSGAGREASILAAASAVHDIRLNDT